MPVDFYHIAWLDVAVPANSVLRLVIDMKGGRIPDRAGFVAQVGLHIPGWIKFVTTLESLYQHCGPQRLPEDMEWRYSLQPGDSDDNDDDCLLLRF